MRYRAQFYIFFKIIHFMLAVCFAELHKTSYLLSWLLWAWRRVLKRNTQFYFQPGPPQHQSSPLLSLSKVNKNHCWHKVNLSLLGNQSIHLTPQLVHPPGDPILPAPHLQAQVVRHPPTSHRARNENMDKEENSECVSRRWQLVAATLSARPPLKHNLLMITCNWPINLLISQWRINNAFQVV